METESFQENRETLLEKALSSIEQLNSNLNSLNRNLETIGDIGTQFKGPANLWRSFHKSVRTSNESTTKPINVNDSTPAQPIYEYLEEPSLGEEERL